MREAALAREMNEYGATDVKYLYMGSLRSLCARLIHCWLDDIGYYIHSCQKMRYKGDYSPSFLLDPVSPLWMVGSITLHIRLGRVYLVSSERVHSAPWWAPIRLFFSSWTFPEGDRRDPSRRLVNLLSNYSWSHWILIVLDVVPEAVSEEDLAQIMLYHRQIGTVPLSVSTVLLCSVPLWFKCILSYRRYFLSCGIRTTGTWSSAR